MEISKHQSTGLCTAMKTQRLGREGAKVVISSRNKENVDTALERLREDGLEAYGVVCHVGLAEQRANLIKEAVSKYGGLDILVSNAGTNPGFEPVLKCTEEKWNKIMDTNVKSGFFLAKEAYPYLKKSVHGPSIVFNSSIGGYEPLAGLGIYSISKTALLALPGVLAKEWGPQIRVNAVAPGIVKTKFSQALWTNKSLMQKTESMIPLRSLATPEQIAGT
eukprot:Ihof_evm4s83 gene=Ihof_evmTU4s83